MYILLWAFPRYSFSFLMYLCVPSDNNYEIVHALLMEPVPDTTSISVYSVSVSYVALLLIYKNKKVYSVSVCIRFRSH